jgi:hypothetical protein
MLTLLTGASLADARIITLPVYLNAALFLGFFFSNLAISATIIWWHSPLHAKSPDCQGYERVWNVLAAIVLGAATIVAVLPSVS